MKVQIPGNFADVLTIDNAAERLDEAKEVAVAILSAGVELAPQMDHAAIFTDPPHLVAGPLKEVGYIA
ncbi:MAG: hypothetical protein HOH77_14200, partial [Candidatus Latescibacteria bacterium]|nr:hypothetical protein [Candidatus Latescibacterota bacterium]